MVPQVTGKQLMDVPETADDFRVAITALRSLDLNKIVIFHNFSLPEDKCVRLLVKNVGTRMPESVVREKMKALEVSVEGDLWLH